MKKVLVTGSTGYIGGRLIPLLLESGLSVTAGARDVVKLRDQPWASKVSVTHFDVLQPKTMTEGLTDVDIAYYLVHSLSSGPKFAETDRNAANVFAASAKEAGVKQIVYLGGITPSIPTNQLSPHLRSRKEVGEILRGSGVPTLELRAAVIIGSGSASFEMLRYLTERLPVMITPKWVKNKIQPIAIRDVLHYLTQAALINHSVNEAFDIGGPDVITYQEMMEQYASIAGLKKRLIIPVPVLTPRLSSHWVGLVTPVPRNIALPLVESLRHEVVCQDHRIADLIKDPDRGLIDFSEALKLALLRVKEANVSTRWSSASPAYAPSDPLPSDPDWSGGSLYIDERSVEVAAPPEVLWKVIESVGGENGWYSFPLAWSVRGWMDRIVGGVGLRRGRRDPNTLRIGDSLDFWRVEEINKGQLLRLRAEMKLPGLAWLEMKVLPGSSKKSSVYTQRAIFYPRGILGHIYWKSISPFHSIVFGGMATNIGKQAETNYSSNSF